MTPFQEDPWDAQVIFTRLGRLAIVSVFFYLCYRSYLSFLSLPEEVELKHMDPYDVITFMFLSIFALAAATIFFQTFIYDTRKHDRGDS